MPQCCPDGQVSCNGECVTLGDTSNCSRCGDQCDITSNDPEICDNGMCRKFCNTPERPDFCETDLECHNLKMENNNCGVCGKECPVGQACREGQCRLNCGTTHHPENCGGADFCVANGCTFKCPSDGNPGSLICT